jgi:hypothetical protein
MWQHPPRLFDIIYHVYMTIGKLANEMRRAPRGDVRASGVRSRKFGPPPLGPCALRSPARLKPDSVLEDLKRKWVAPRDPLFSLLARTMFTTENPPCASVRDKIVSKRNSARRNSFDCAAKCLVQIGADCRKNDGGSWERAALFQVKFRASTTRQRHAMDEKCPSSVRGASNGSDPGSAWRQQIFSFFQRRPCFAERA